MKHQKTVVRKRQVTRTPESSTQKWVHLAGDLEAKPDGRGYVEIRMKRKPKTMLFLNESALQKARTLAVRERLNRKRDATVKPPVLPVPTTRTRPASGRGDAAYSFEWIRRNREQYTGQWVALIGGTLVDHDRSRRELQKRINSHTDLCDVLVVKLDSRKDSHS